MQFNEFEYHFACRRKDMGHMLEITCIAKYITEYRSGGKVDEGSHGDV